MFTIILHYLILLSNIIWYTLSKAFWIVKKNTPGVNRLSSKASNIWLSSWIVNTLRYVGKAWEHFCWSIVYQWKRSPPLKTGLNPAIFKSSGNIVFSSDKSIVNSKKSYNSPKHFSATLNIVSGCVATHFWDFSNNS